MKKKICLTLVFLICLINFQVNAKGLAISKTEAIFKENVSFVENGVKLEYKSKDDKRKILNDVSRKIKEIKNDCNINYSDSMDSLNTSFDNEQIICDIYDGKEDSLVELVIVNKNNNKDLLILMKELAYLQSKNSSEKRYFQYIKGKINNEDTILENIKGKFKLRNIETLNIHNGYVGTANLYDGERVSIAVSNYDTGTYLIIGSPIIFTTY